MVSGSSKCQRKLRLRKLQKQGVWVYDQANGWDGRWTDEGFKASKGKDRK